MRRFFIDEIKEKEGPLVIKGQEARHIARVLRLGTGDRLILFDGKGSRFQAVIQSIGGGDVTVLIERPLPRPPGNRLRTTLCQALLKSRAMDDVVRKTSELGIDRILPFFSERTVPRFNQKKYIAKQKHWQEIAKNAAKQADRIKPVTIGPLSSFTDLISATFEEESCRILLWEGEKKRTLRQFMRSAPPSSHFVGFVGPEGGFSKKEAGAAGDKGILSLSLGHRILKADTAAVTLAAIVQYEWGDLGPAGDEVFL